MYLINEKAHSRFKLNSESLMVAIEALGYVFETFDNDLVDAP